MAVAHDATGSTAKFAAGSWASGSSFSWTHTLTSASNGYLIVIVFLFGSARTVTGVTAAGSAMTSLADKTNSDILSTWGIKSAGLGTSFTVAVSLSGSNSLVNCFADSYTGVDQTTPTGTVTNNSGTGTALSVTATLPSNGVVAGCFLHHYTFSVWTTGQTLGQRSGSVNAQKGRALLHAYSTSTGSMTATADSSQTWAAAGVPLNAAGAAANEEHFLMTMGVGSG